MTQQQVHAEWQLAEEQFDSNKNKHFEGLFTQGNGYLSIRGSFEEGLRCAPQDEDYLRMPANVTLESPRNPVSKYGTYIPGIVGRHPLLKEEIINLPYMLDFKVYFEGEQLDLQESRISKYCRWLDLHDGTLHREFVWTTKAGAIIKLYYKRFISMKQRNLVVQRIAVQVLEGSGQISFESGIDARVRTNGHQHLNDLKASQLGGTGLTLESTTDLGNKVSQATILLDDQALQWSYVFLKEHAYMESTAQVKAGTELMIRKLSAVSTDRDISAEGDEASIVQILGDAAMLTFNQLYGEHAACWNNKWNDSDILIDGDARVQKGLRVSMYHLMRSNPENDPRVSICAKGYAGEAYFGRYFWDTEINMLPYFIYTHPEAARNLLMFRYQTLPGARKNALAYGYHGARYAWESSLTGEEQCPNWQYADHEVHITADIAYGLWHYYQATGDEEFLKNYGIDILVETSRYWGSRVDQNHDGRYNLLGVMGPDEYSPFTRNNAFTNRMVKFNLEKTLVYLEHLRNNDAEAYFFVKQRLEVKEEELYHFKDVLDHLIMPYDAQSELILQSEDFPDFADLDLAEYWKDRTKPFGNFISQEKLYRSKCLKQADVLELMALFPDEFSRGQMETAYHYYEPMTTHDSSLSAGVHAIICAWLHLENEVELFLQRCLDIDLSVDKAGAAEGIHIANCGSLWQLVVFGFAGLRPALSAVEPVVVPNLPAHWRSIEIPLVWKGRSCRLKVTHHGTQLTSEEGQTHG